LLSRYGGTLLGPARFSHIETCAHEVCHAFKRKEEFEECISTLKTLDDILADLRTELHALTPKDPDLGPSADTQANPILRPPKPPDYSSMVQGGDILKARRLVSSRENAIKSVKAMLAGRKSETAPKT
jgi:hypothetical protein